MIVAYQLILDCDVIATRAFPSMPQPEIKAVCFDMDGLLFNTEDLYDELGLEMLRRRGKQYDPDLVRRMMGLQAQPALQLFIEHYDLTDTVEELMAEADEFFDAILPERLSLLPGALAMLEYCSRDHARPLALTTSSGRASVERIMSLYDLRHFFDFWLTAEDIEQSKPHPEIYQTAAARHGVKTEDMLVFEDSENGCKAGVSAGAHVVAIPSKLEHDYTGSLFVAATLEDERIRALFGD